MTAKTAEKDGRRSADPVLGPGCLLQNLLRLAQLIVDLGQLGLKSLRS